MDPAELKQIVEWLRTAGLTSVEIDSPGVSIRLSIPSGEKAVVSQTASVRVATATTVGLFLDRHPLRTTPFVQVGAAVEPGDIVGLVRNGRILSPITAPLAGTVTNVLVAPGMIIDYGRAIIAIASNPHIEG
jgi:acetyl-CoA carboxylase biotin carboxyl carrier protein